MASYLLIGGKTISSGADFSLEESAFKLLGLINPTILFIPYAQDILIANHKFQLITANYSGEILYMEENMNIITMDFLFSKADVIYFGGGSALNLISLVKNSNLLSLMKKYQNTNKIFAGISAGAILFCRYGMGDQYAYKNASSYYNYQMVEGVGFLDITICPHYDHDGLWCYNDVVWDYAYDGYALEDDTAILLADTIHILKKDKTKSIYYFSQKKHKMIPLYEEIL